MTTTYDLGTNVGKVRLKIGDTNETNAHFTNEEITVFLDEVSSDINGAAGLALIAWAAALGREDERVSTGVWEGDRRDIVRKMLALANTLFDIAGIRPRPPAVSSKAIDWGT